ncbi:class I SAM-dependent methyltransferase [Gloeocapsopsis crepidinum LEGE 06123]|uniref:Class I SAM-dependent methyltransferase n=1 Tax=Gloeocapsopsis crepidinum LEGE 06123 TaxID=588587 RepID=A0ABR9UXK6_9CHRO|nr:class I SAM-dependent methyltransferase [Gloeocapsopsis crepidinum]MBE9193011.1 class I SAM-dependent methyltransferase [Gloeocapsopsis crepidinum LEGE 06123]
MIKEIQEQIAYYNARSQEYDEWFYRIGRYDRGLQLNQRWFDEVDILKSALQDIGKVNSILELACGTGIWTQELLKLSNKITAIDASAEMIAINKKKLNDTKIVDYHQVDLLSWQPTTQYDLVFFSFWLSHVPPAQVDDFLAKVYRAVRPYGKVFIIDSCFDATSTAKDHFFENEKAIYQRRKLNNGQEYQIYKIYYQPNVLLDKFIQVGFQASVKQTNNYFIYAEGIKSG